MPKKKSKLVIAREETEKAILSTNEKINELGLYTRDLYDALSKTQAQFDAIRNIPSDDQLQYDQLKQVRLNWKQQADKIEADYNKAQEAAVGHGAAGIGLGVAVAALGPTAAMGIATTFGVASTGTAIATLHGAAAVNAALAWLGGGALAAGGGGMLAGKALLAMAGPIGWAIAGIATIGSGLMLLKNHSDKKRLEDIFTLISERDKKSYHLAIVELNERIARIRDEIVKLIEASVTIKSFGSDYMAMSEAQQYELGSYVNLMLASTQLLVNPILGLQPKYTESDYKKSVALGHFPEEANKDLVLYLANLLYKIEIDDKDKKLLISCFKKNKDFIKTFEISKKDLSISLLDGVESSLLIKDSKDDTLSRHSSDQNDALALPDSKVERNSTEGVPPTLVVVSGNIADAKADAIVLPANENLLEGPGASAAIFEAAGRSELTEACRKEGKCKVGSAVVTPAFNLDADYIIHAVVPKWRGGKHNEYDLLCSAYLSALNLADEMECESVAFPLLASGNNGFDYSMAFDIAKLSIQSFKASHLKQVFLVLFNKTKEGTTGDISGQEFTEHIKKDPVTVNSMINKAKEFLDNHPHFVDDLLKYSKQILDIIIKLRTFF